MKSASEWVREVLAKNKAGNFETWPEPAAFIRAVQADALRAAHASFVETPPFNELEVLGRIRALIPTNPETQPNGDGMAHSGRIDGNRSADGTGSA